MLRVRMRAFSVNGRVSTLSKEMDRALPIAKGNSSSCSCVMISYDSLVVMFDRGLLLLSKLNLILISRGSDEEEVC